MADKMAKSGVVRQTSQSPEAKFEESQRIPEDDTIRLLRMSGQWQAGAGQWREEHQTPPPPPPLATSFLPVSETSPLDSTQMAESWLDGGRGGREREGRESELDSSNSKPSMTSQRPSFSPASSSAYSSPPVHSSLLPSGKNQPTISSFTSHKEGERQEDEERDGIPLFRDSMLGGGKTPTASSAKPQREYEEQRDSPSNLRSSATNYSSSSSAPSFASPTHPLSFAQQQQDHMASRYLRPSVSPPSFSAAPAPTLAMRASDRSARIEEERTWGAHSEREQEAD
eukprot:971291-Rhodomonas_salina.1